MEKEKNTQTAGTQEMSYTEVLEKKKEEVKKLTEKCETDGATKQDTNTTGDVPFEGPCDDPRVQAEMNRKEAEAETTPHFKAEE